MPVTTIVIGTMRYRATVPEGPGVVPGVVAGTAGYARPGVTAAGGTFGEGLLLGDGAPAEPDGLGAGAKEGMGVLGVAGVRLTISTWLLCATAESCLISSGRATVGGIRVSKARSRCCCAGSPGTS